MTTVFALLLLAFPRRFRVRFGREMADQAAADAARAFDEGWSKGVWCVVATGTDLVRTGMAERPG